MALNFGICHWILNYFQDLQMMTFGLNDLFSSPEGSPEEFMDYPRLWR